MYIVLFYRTGLEGKEEQYMSVLKSILNIYTEESLNDLKLALDSEEYSLEQIQDNVIIICLTTQGIGTISLVLKEKFQNYLLKTLYLILEKAG